MINEVLRLLRIANDMSRKELAQKTGLSQSYIGEIENGTKNPSLDTIDKYSTVLGISKSSIIYFSEKMSKENYSYQKILLQILQTITEM